MTTSEAYAVLLMVFYVLMCLFLFLIQKTSLLSFFQLFSPSATLSCFVDRFLPVLYLTVCSCAEHSVYEIFKSRQVFAFPLQNHSPIFWEEKKKPWTTKQTEHSNFEAKLFFFFFFQERFEKSSSSKQQMLASELALSVFHLETSSTL